MSSKNSVKSKQIKSKKELKKERDHRSKIAGYIGTAVALFIVGAIGITVFAVRYSPNYAAYKVNDTVIRKDIYNCAYYYDTLGSQNWQKYGYDTQKNPYKQKLTYDFADGSYNTWGDYFEHLSENTLKFCCIMNDMAKKNGYEYTAKAEENALKELKTVESERTDKNVSFKDFMQVQYGAEISKSTLKKYLEMYYKAMDFYDALVGDKAVFCKYTGCKVSDIEEMYNKNVDKYDSVSFRYYALSDTEANAAKIDKLKNAASEEQFKSYCNTFSSSTADYKKNDKSLYKGYSLYTINKVCDGKAVDFLTSKKSKAGEIFSYRKKYEGKYIVEVIYLVSPRGKNTQAYNKTNVSTWEFQVMSDMLETYYKKNYKTQRISKGINEFKKNIVVLTTAAAD